ncbi:MAG: hypothetical protein AAGH45_04740, partial [Pseudomonadota bacterium]
SLLLRMAGLVAIVLFGLFAVSEFFTTLDGIESTPLRLAYTGVIAAGLIAAAYAAWRLVRPARSKRRRPQDKPAPRVIRRPSEAQLTDLAAKYAIVYGEPTLPSGESPAPRIAVISTPGVGTEALTSALTQGAPGALALGVFPPFTGELAHDQDLLTLAARADRALFVVDEDLKGDEVGLIKALTEARSRVVLALNRADRLSTEERAETEASLKRKVSALGKPIPVISATPDPLPVRVLIREEDGSERLGEEQPEPDVASLLKELAK